MFKKEYFIGMLVAFLCLGLFGTALADEGLQSQGYDYDASEAGNWEFDFDAPETMSTEAARSYQYDQETLAVIGTEAGNWEFDFNAPETKATIAARNYQYDQEILAVVGTEAGVWEYQFDSPESGDRGAIAVDGDGFDAMCSEC